MPDDSISRRPPRMTLWRVRVFLRELREEISRRRKENNSQREKRTWNSESVVKLELVKLLDWIENELDKINLGSSR
jgi:hypothetical protein